MELGLDGSRILVAGASRGLGFAITDLLLSEGASVAAAARDAAALQGAATRLRRKHGDGRLHTVAVDLSLRTSVEPLRRAIESLGGLDGLVVVAGSGTSAGGAYADAFATAASENVAPALVSVEACAPELQRSARGAIVLISSIAGLEYMPCPPEYAAAKATLSAYASHWSRQLRPVRVNTVAPGNMQTVGSVWERRKDADPAALASYLQTEVTLGRLGEPEEVARVSVFLLSTAASFMTGSTVVVDGGQVRRW